MITELYQKYYQELKRYMRHQTNSESLAEDVIQETFLRAVEREKVFQSLRENQCRAWLYKTAKNIWVDWVRHQNAYPKIQEKGYGDGDLSFIEVSNLLEVLDGRDRAIFYLRYEEGYSAKEIAEMFQMTHENVRARLSIARKQLKKEMEYGNE